MEIFNVLELKGHHWRICITKLQKPVQHISDYLLGLDFKYDIRLDSKAEKKIYHFNLKQPKYSLES